MLSNKTYDTLKWIAQFLLPALGTLYFALAGIWNFPYGEQVVGTITAVDTFLGVLLGISTVQYNKENNIGWHNKKPLLAESGPEAVFYLCKPVQRQESRKSIKAGYCSIHQSSSNGIISSQVFIMLLRRLTIHS